MKHKLENDPSDIVSFKDVFPAFREVGEKHSRVDFFLTPILANDGQAEEISEYAEKFGITSFKYYLHMVRPEASGWLSQKRIGFFGFDDGTVYRGMEHVARLGLPAPAAFSARTGASFASWRRDLKKRGGRIMGHGMTVHRISSRQPTFGSLPISPAC